MTEIARLKIELDEMEAPVLRHIEVPRAIRLADLHLVIQAAMGWENYHLYEFRVGRTVAYGLPDPDWPDQATLSAKQATLDELLGHLKRNKTFQYIYDFGDDWLHWVKLEALVAADPELAYPRLVSAQGRCPPEDCGGPWGMAITSKPSPTPTMKTMTTCSTGAARASTPTPSMKPPSGKPLQNSPNPGVGRPGQAENRIRGLWKTPTEKDYRGKKEGSAWHGRAGPGRARS